MGAADGANKKVIVDLCKLTPKNGMDNIMVNPTGESSTSYNT